MTFIRVFQRLCVLAKIIFMQKNQLFLFFLLIFYCGVHAQNYTISGFVADSSTGEKVIGASIFDTISKNGTGTNDFGFYSLTLPKGKHVLRYSTMGFETIYKTIDLQKNISIPVKISTQAITLKEVEITVDHTKQKVESTQMSSFDIPISAVKSLPFIMGEVDIIKSIQLLPGIKGGTEGTSGLYVRGGGPDQNLILLDGVPVYNVNHLFGFFSVFNADAINHVKMTTGGFPARYGSRLSSVLDIHMKEGNTNKLKGEGSIGLIASKFTIEGPIKKDKASFIISGRRTYIDVLAKPIIAAIGKSQNFEKFGVGYYFYDLNSKINYKITERSHLYLSAYTGTDKAFMRMRETFAKDDYSESTADIHWGNLTTAARWNYKWTDKLFSNATLTYSNYEFFTGSESINKIPQSKKEDTFSMNYSSGIKDWSIKYDVDYIPNPKHYIKAGGHAIYHTFSPGVLAFKTSYADDNFKMDTTFGSSNIYAWETALYIEDDYTITEKLKMNIGFRHSGFFVQENYYNEIEPRFAFRYLINPAWSVKAGVSEMNQYILLLSNSTIGLPTDLWVPVTQKIKPMHGMQYGIGVTHAINKQIDVSVETYYKEMKNLIEYKEGASYFSVEQNSWENKVEQGKGDAYGAEVLIQKHAGKLTGWIGYTLAWSTRTFENLNFGKSFPYRYDRRHDISVVANYKFSEKIDMGMVWVYGTGNAVTMPTYKYQPLEINPWYTELIESPESRNAFRMPSYHRLDVSINIHKQKKRGMRTWSFGLYNAYSRQNPFYLFFDREYSDSGQSYPVLKQISLFPLIPSVSYSFKF